MRTKNRKQGLTLAERVQQEGTVVKENTFETNKGNYTIRIIKHVEQLYFHKTLNGQIVECVNLMKEV